MSVDKATVHHIAHLARLRIDDDRAEALVGELNNILNWVEQLNEVNTEDIAPMTSAVEAKLHWRDDEVTDGGIRDHVLSDAPDAQYGFYAVPKVIE